jgi:hypothetical protein
MSRSLALHPFSLVTGLALGVVCLLSMSQIGPVAQNVLVSYGPNARDYVQIRGGTPYAVPAGKLFVLTALSPSAGVLKVNGVEEVSMMPPQALNSEPFPSVCSVPNGFTVAAGSTIELCNSGGGSCLNTSHRAWGYLAPQ